MASFIVTVGLLDGLAVSMTDPDPATEAATSTGLDESSRDDRP